MPKNPKKEKASKKQARAATQNGVSSRKGGGSLFVLALAIVYATRIQRELKLTAMVIQRIHVNETTSSANDSLNSSSRPLHHESSGSNRVLDLYYERRKNHFLAQVCANTSTPDPHHFPEFCYHCPSFDGQNTCGQKAIYWESTYGSTTRDVVTKLVKAGSCCVPVLDRRTPNLLALPKDRIVPGNNSLKNNRATDDRSTTISGEEGPITAWCILDAQNTAPHDMLMGPPHAAQALLPCWSYFSRVWEKRPSAQCGIWFSNPYIAHPFRLHQQNNNKEAWIAGMMNGMNCSYAFDPKPPAMMNKPNAWQYRISGTGDWFEVSADATRLAEKLGLDTAAPTPTLSSPPGNSKNALKIGLVQRRRTQRNITNLPIIQSEIQKAYPTATVEYAEMEDFTFLEQAKFWNRQDVIVLAHGAAVINSIFMRRKTAVVEIFPEHYYVMMYQDLCATAEIHHFGWTHDVEFLGFDFEKHCRFRQRRYALRASPLTPPVDRIMDLVHQAVNATISAANQ